MYGYGTFAVYLGYRHESPIDVEMESILREKTKHIPEKYAKYLFLLTRPPKLLKTQLLELEILKLANEAKGKKLHSKKDVERELGGKVKKLKEKYDFLSYDLCDSVGWGLDHYINLIIEKKNGDLDGQIKSPNNYERDAEREFERICKELDMTSAEKHLLDLIRHLGYFKWAREHEFIEGFYNAWPVMKELGRRVGITGPEAMFVLPEEYPEALKSPKKWLKIAQERRKLGVLICGKDGMKFLIRKEAEKYLKGMGFVQERVGIETNEMKGMPACSGKARGIVKIINTIKDVHKMGKGNILVSAATTPDLVPAMKKAAAIITNEGGITCHAAIVSRELKIPCIVGVKNANKILKDGDEIEVDANRGIISKVLRT
jgi:phosphoenolpyruvate synthase/pyruvate phosphate dikinase